MSPEASDQVLAQSDLRFRRRCGLKNFKMSTMVAILNLYVTPISPIKFLLNLHWEEMLFEDFQDGRLGCHLGYWNGTILAVLNLHVSLMPPTKFQLNLTYCSRADVVSRQPLWRPSWILERNEFSNFKSPYHPNASHQV